MIRIAANDSQPLYAVHKYHHMSAFVSSCIMTCGESFGLNCKRFLGIDERLDAATVTFSSIFEWRNGVVGIGPPYLVVDSPADVWGKT
jgi:hypothetical protein